MARDIMGENDCNRGENKGGTQMNLEFANRLIALRKGCGLSQEELAQRIGVSRQAVSKWERGEASPDTYNLVELSKVFNVTLDELVTGCKDADDAPKTSPNEGKGITIDGRGIRFTKDGQTKSVISFDGDGIHICADDSDDDEAVKSAHDPAHLVPVHQDDGDELTLLMNPPHEHYVPETAAARYNAYLNRVRSGEARTKGKYTMGL